MNTKNWTFSTAPVERDQLENLTPGLASFSVHFTLHRGAEAR